jgi:hypothetical protein
MTALIEDLKVGLVTADDADQHIGPVVLSEVGAQTALSVMNCLHSFLLRHRMAAQVG